MSDWPTFCPEDLRRALEEVEGMRWHTGPQDQWTAIREWLVKHQIEPPVFVLPAEEER